ncbi:MAG TPA: hypothetical protein VIH30_08500, partial [Aquirhabdus sp.]
RKFIKNILVVAILTLSLQAFANPVVSNTALNYSADQSIQPIATHTPLKVTSAPVVHKPVIKHRTKKSKPLHQHKHKTHRHPHQKSRASFRTNR